MDKSENCKTLCNQAERPDYRFMASLFLMGIGIFLIASTHNPQISPERNKISGEETMARGGGNITLSDMRGMVRDDLDNLKNLNDSDITHLFGAPDYIRQEEKILIWQYKSDECVMDIYWDGRSQSSNVSYASTRSRSDAQKPNQDYCLDSFF